MSNTDGAFVTLASGVQIPKVALVRSTDGADASVSSGPTATGAFIQITATSASFPLAPPGDATTALVQVEAQSMRYRPDATAPTASVGVLLPAGAQLTLRGAEMAAARFIAVNTGAILNVYFSK